MLLSFSSVGKAALLASNYLKGIESQCYVVVHKHS